MRNSMKVNRCPSCKENGDVHLYEMDEDNTFMYKCRICYLTTELAYSKKDARRKWNSLIGDGYNLKKGGEDERDA